MRDIGKQAGKPKFALINDQPEITNHLAGDIDPKDLNAVSTVGITDTSDRATAIEMSFTAESLRAAREKCRPETHPDFDGSSCVECGEVIPKARLKLGRVRCTACQEILEKKLKFFRS